MTKLIIKALMLTVAVITIILLTLLLCTWLARVCGNNVDFLIIMLAALSVIVIFGWSFAYLSAKEDNEQKED
jgi:hypothetical protein